MAIRVRTISEKRKADTETTLYKFDEGIKENIFYVAHETNKNFLQSPYPGRHFTNDLSKQFLFSRSPKIYSIYKCIVKTCIFTFYHTLILAQFCSTFRI